MAAANTGSLNTPFSQNPVLTKSQGSHSLKPSVLQGGAGAYPSARCKHMREAAERRQQLELEHEQALAVLSAKQQEIDLLQKAQVEAKKEHEGAVHLLEPKMKSSFGRATFICGTGFVSM
ncbi:hypothetical protein NFI96_008812 [Prochilodus magdalenae]|nr:hypothetical protein NFI96_008812 [Prochilodus magdalenae]